MSKILKAILSEHDFEHSFKMKKSYSGPSIYDAKGDLSQRWYVYFSYRNSDTGELKRFPNNLYVSNSLDAAERRAALKSIKKNLLELLKDGLNPFEAEQFVNSKKTPEEKEEDKIKNMSIVSAFEFAVTIKKGTQNETSHTNFKSRIERFKKWLNENGFENKDIHSLKKITITKYLNFILQTSKPRNRNNTRVDLSGLFQVLVDNEIIKENIVSSIPILLSKPEKNRPFTSTQEKQLFDYMDANNPILALYVRFVSYTFLREVEVNRIRISDLHLSDKTIHNKTKTGFKIKIIPDLLAQHLPDLSDMAPDAYLFGRIGYGEIWDVKESYRRSYYGRLFLEVKRKFGYGKEYGIYSFRHSRAISLFNTFLKTMTPDEAENKLMSITGHETKTALRKYLRETNAYRPEDYSQYL